MECERRCEWGEGVIGAGDTFRGSPSGDGVVIWAGLLGVYSRSREEDGWLWRWPHIDKTKNRGQEV